MCENGRTVLGHFELDFGCCLREEKCLVWFLLTPRVSLCSEPAWLSPWWVYVLVGGCVARLICLILGH